jgi:hypothetical protein
VFVGELKFEPIKEAPGEFVLLGPWIWVHPTHGEVCIPPGFITDFASTPQLLRALRIFDPVRSGSIFAALPHDWLYCTQLRPREECDEILRVALIESGMSSVAARTYWMGVRMGGWLPWKRRLERGGGVQPDDFANGRTYAEYKRASIPQPEA